MLEGNIVSLRAIERDDLIQLRDWRNKESFRKYFREYRELNLKNQEHWFEKYVINDQSTIMFGIVESTTGELVGVCGLCYINWIYRFADLSIYIGKNGIYMDVETDGYAWDTMNLLGAYAFKTINLHKIWCEIYSYDMKKRTFLEKYGFKRDGILRDNYFYNGEYMDSYIYSLLAHEWKGNE